VITPHEDSRRRPNGRRTTRQYTAKTLRTRCNALREQLLGQQLATAAELAAVWPGGPENGLTGFDGWIACFAQLTRFAGRLEALSSRQAPDATLLENTVRAAAARQPVSVTLSIGDRLVYPKSAWALSWLDSLDAIMRPVARLVTELADTQGAPDEELRGLTALTQGMACRTWAWILLTEGVGLPFPSEGVIDPPEFTEHLLPEDYLAIFVAHRKLHFEAVAIMAAAMPDEERTERSRLSLSGFLSGYASEHGVPPSHLMRRWSFPEAMAAAVAAAEAQRVAEANAKAKRREGAS
jgi:hypothetical protein